MGGAALAIGGAILSSRSSRKSADKARREGRRLTGSQLEEERFQFEATRADQAPFLQAGTEALNQQRILLGLGASDPDANARAEIQAEIDALEAAGPTPLGLVNARTGKQFGGGSGAIGKLLGRIADKNAASPEGIAAAQKAHDDKIAVLREELGGLGQAPQGTAQEQQAQAFQSFVESPGQKFIRDRAQRSLLRNQGAIGGLGGGNVRSGLVQQGAGFAQQDFQNQFGRLGQLAGQGQASAQSIGALGSASIGRQGQLVSNQIDRSSALRGAAGGAKAQLFSDIAQIGGSQFGGSQ
jgi:hypothetical protein